MTLDKALAYAFECDTQLADEPEQAIITLAAEVRRLQSEVTALRLYAPAQRAGKMDWPVQIAPTNWPAWGIVGIVQETDEEFKAWGNAHTEVAR